MEECARGRGLNRWSASCFADIALQALFLLARLVLVQVCAFAVIHVGGVFEQRFLLLRLNKRKTLRDPRLRVVLVLRK